MNNVTLKYDDRCIDLDSLGFDPLFSFENIIREKRLVIQIEVQSSIDKLDNISKDIEDNIKSVSVRNREIWTKEETDSVAVVTSVGTNGCISGDKPTKNNDLKLSIFIYVSREVL